MCEQFCQKYQFYILQQRKHGMFAKFLWEISKNCASLLNIESLGRESTGLLSPPQVRWWGYIGSQPSIPSTPRDSGTGSGHLSSLEPQSPRVCSCPSPQKVAGSVHMSSYTWEKKKFHMQMAEMKLDAICISFSIFLNKESKKGNRETLWSCHSILRLLFLCFLKKKHRSGSKEGITPNTGKHLKMLVIEYKECKWLRVWRHQQEEGLGWGKEAVCGLGYHEDKLAGGCLGGSLCPCAGTLREASLWRKVLEYCSSGFNCVPSKDMSKS